MKKIKIAQIGIGHDHADAIFKSILKQKDIYDFVGYYVIKSELIDCGYKLNMSCFKEVPQITLDEILNNKEIQAVAIETDEKNLSKYALMCAENNKSIHMDKPGGFVLSDFEKLISVVKKKNSIFHLGYMYRYNPVIINLVNQIKNGEFGEIFSVEANMDVYHTKDKRQWMEKFPGGMTFFLGCHLIDLILTIMGKPEEIIPLNCNTGVDGVTSCDYGMVILKYKNGVSFAKTCDVEIGGFDRRQLVITGSKATAEIRPLEVLTDYPKMYTRYKISTLENNSEVETDFQKSEIFDRYDDMMKAFALMVAGEKTNPWSYDYELELFKTILECCK